MTLSQTAKHAVETRHFSKPQEDQGPGISWQDNVHYFLGCWRCIAYWLC